MTLNEIESDLLEKGFSCTFMQCENSDNIQAIMRPQDSYYGCDVVKIEFDGTPEDFFEKAQDAVYDGTEKAKEILECGGRSYSEMHEVIDREENAAKSFEEMRQYIIVLGMQSGEEGM